MESRSWLVTCQDAGDGSGDLMLILPDEFMAESGWSIGEELNFEQQEDGSWRVSKMEKNVSI
ncbi:AbrB/MazE/SpoVT family DNA-binding domain-containing protein [Pseudomonas cavernicola]|uniref:AbrB/MazE/SpoVT family DNA-binding domain-containing protein n=1 Tax=Pseudomonas cavernicola TaxID=2320866 RepID=UPI001EE62BA2|nr:AbrB/MazE/SpoVT family DNA-binding domain-containing protein [Pseudomonas cavernicola]